MAQTLGIIDLWWTPAGGSATKLPTEKGATIRLAGYKNNTVNAGRQTFRTQEYVNGEVKATIPLQAGESLASLMPGAEGELQVVCDTGQTITSSDAYITDVPTATGDGGGKRQVTWNFGTYTELLATS